MEKIEMKKCEKSNEVLRFINNTDEIVKNYLKNCSTSALLEARYLLEKEPFYWESYFTINREIERRRHLKDAKRLLKMKTT